MSQKANIDSLSQFEWLIMNEVWELENASAREIKDALPETAQRAYTTIQTYLERLVEKGYLKKEKQGIINYYAPRLPRETIVEGATTRFIDRVFQGSGSSLAAYLIQSNALGADDLEKIKQILDGDENA